MKLRKLFRYIFVFNILWLLITVENVSAAERAPLKPLPHLWYLGKIKQGAVKTKDFYLKNLSKDIVEIKKVHSCCGYSVDIQSWRINPGERVKAEVECDAARKSPGEDRKYLTIMIKGDYTSEINVSVGANIIEVKKKKETTTPEISATELKKWISTKGNLIVLDVREKSEFNYVKIEEAINYPKSKFGTGTIVPEDLKKRIRKDSLIVVGCGGGIRSHYITRKLRDFGYDAFNLKGGLGAWRKEGYPVEVGEEIPFEKDPIRINTEEAYEHYYVLFKDKAVWVDARSTKDYENGHITGAISLPLYMFEEKASILPKDKDIILYCDGYDCDEAVSAGRYLMENGYKQALIKVYEGGYTEWTQKAYPRDAAHD